MKGIRMWHPDWQFPENTVFHIPEFELFYSSSLLSLIHLHSGGWQCWSYLSSPVLDSIRENPKFKPLNPKNESSQCTNNCPPEMLFWNWQCSGKGFQHSEILLAEATHCFHSCLFECGFFPSFYKSLAIFLPVFWYRDTPPSLSFTEKLLASESNLSTTATNFSKSGTCTFPIHPLLSWLFYISCGNCISSTIPPYLDI